MINGVKFFAMGADYIPEDCVYNRITRERMEYLVRSSVKAHYNCLRAVSYTHLVSDWKRKKTNPSADKIMIICEVFGISPYELLQGTDNQKLKEYQQPNYIMIDRDSKEYRLIEVYQNLSISAQKRLEGYLDAINDLNK